MHNDTFTKAIRNLNSAQKEAVDAIEGAVMVIAGPGTGKTQILTLRIANILLKTQINPENVLALTFTESGVYAMRKRLVEIVGTPGYRVQINTFHGFCNDLIKNNPEDFPEFISSDNADELEQLQIIEEIVDNGSFQFLKPFGEPFYYVRPVRDAIGELKKEGISVAVFEEALVKEEEAFKKNDDIYHDKGAHKGKMKGVYEKQFKNIQKNKELLTIYKAYQEALHTKKLYDFNDMLLEVARAFEKNPEFLLRVQEQYHYILVDEHQDTNAAQNKVIELICNFHDNPNLFVVGDEKQSIYRFQGASLENFLYFKKLYPDALLINLKDNYRSSQTILDASGSLIANNILASAFMPENAKLTAQSKHPDERIKIISFADYYAEYYWIAESIKKKIAQGVPPSEIAILAKENRDAVPFVDIFDQEGISYVIESNLNVLSDIEIQKLILLFSAIHNFGNESDLIKAMHIDSLGISPMDIVALVHLAKKKKTTVWEILDSGVYKKELKLKSLVAIETLYDNLIEWDRCSHNERFDYLFKSVLNKSGLLKHLLTKRNALQNLDKVTGFYEDIKGRIEKKPSFNLDDFMDYLALIRKHEISIKRTVKTVRKDAVHIMTAHKSKGLEFDVVYIINCYDGHWGNARKRGSNFIIPWDYLQEKVVTLSDAEKNEDERRLFYVALTRARKEVIISYSLYGADGKERVPSQFCEEILELYKELVDVQEFEKQFLERKEIILSSLTKATNEDVINEYLANKELFAELFSRKGFAATHLNNYLACPWRYFFRNLLGLPDVMTKSLMFGSAIHHALNTYLEKQKTRDVSISFLLDSYNHALNNQPLTESEVSELKERGKSVLMGYYNQEMAHWKNNRISELAIKGVRFSDAVKLTGKIDMIEPIEGTDEVIVTDFKTGKPKSRGVIEGTTQSGNGDYKRQLVFYKILLDRYQFKKMKMHTGVIEFIEPNERGKYKREVFTITEEDVKNLEKQIEEVTNEIINFGFWNKGCMKADCEYCLLRSYIGG
jgi:DNA helicase II / ATP-dependent DNA helicase PcrA